MESGCRDWTRPCYPPAPTHSERAWLWAGCPATAAPPVVEAVEPLDESDGVLVLLEPLKEKGAIVRSPGAANPPGAPENADPLAVPPGSLEGPWLFDDGREVGRLLDDPVAEPHGPTELPGAFDVGVAMFRLAEPVGCARGQVELRAV